MKASIQKRMVSQPSRKQLKKKPMFRRGVGRMLSESEDELDFTCTMSENLSSFQRPGIASTGTALLTGTPSSDVVKVNSGREGSSKEAPDLRDLSPASKKASGLYHVISDWFTVFDADSNGWIDKREFNVSPLSSAMAAPVEACCSFSFHMWLQWFQVWFHSEF